MEAEEGSRPAPELTFRPLSSDSWSDLETLFGRSGAWGGCWCMWWRLSSADFERSRGDPNRQALRRLALEGDPIGVLAYEDGRPVGWCSVAPREDFPRLERSPILKRVDDAPTWSIVCFYIARPYRGMGLMGRLVHAALEYAHDHGATMVEAYPLEPRSKPYPPSSAWTGFPAPFLKAGFKEVLRRKASRPILRWQLGDDG